MIGKPADINANPNDVWDHNFKKITENIDKKFGKELTDDLYNFYVEEIGLEKVVKFLEEQDRLLTLANYGYMDLDSVILKEDNKINYNKPPEDFNEDEDESDKTKEEYNIDTIKASLLKNFLNQLVEEIPTNSVFISGTDAIDFIKTYQIKFLYEVIIPSSETNNVN